MKPMDALRAGTSADAELLGLADKIGTLESGKLADIVAVPGNPLQDIRQTEHVFFVMKEGVVYKNELAATPRDALKSAIGDFQRTHESRMTDSPEAETAGE